MSEVNSPKGKKNRKGGMPKFVEERLQKWEALHAKYVAGLEAKAADETKICVELPDGKKVHGVAYGTTPADILKDSEVKGDIVVAEVDGAMWDLNRPLEGNCKLEFHDFESEKGAEVFWHSSSHLLGQGLEMFYKDAQLCKGPPLEHGGFFYDVYLGEDRPVVPKDFSGILKLMRKATKGKGQPFQRLVLTKEEALDMFSYNRFKKEIINMKVPDGELCTAYRCGPLIDLCRGPHLPSTNYIKSVKLTKNSSAYWLNVQTNPSLQRVYGMSFPNTQRMREWEEFMRQAAKRDHRVLGTKQELFFFDEISPGSCFFLPHGTIIYNKLVAFIREQYHKRDYSEVVTPNIFNLDLWRTSGHLQNYKDNMFILECDEAKYGMKPMNCPGHCVLYQHKAHSYRDLPVRIADFGVLHRNEVHGALSGLTRVRRFQQDDAHIFCRRDQVADEIAGVLDMLKEVYDVFGFTYDLKLSTRPEKYVGEIETWDEAEQDLEEVLNKFTDQWTFNHGDGAFYGPKIDIELYDALKRKHQCATIQLDFQLPQRFGLHYESESKEEKNRPVMVHRAILGSVERLIAVLCEHTGGKWPFWLSPRQIAILPVSERFNDLAHKFYMQLKEEKFQVEVDKSGHTVPKKIRSAQAIGFNVMIVMGEQEEKSGKLTLRWRDQYSTHTVDREEFLNVIREMRKSRTRVLTPEKWADKADDKAARDKVTKEKEEARRAAAKAAQAAKNAEKLKAKQAKQLQQKKEQGQ